MRLNYKTKRRKKCDFNVCPPPSWMDISFTPPLPCPSVSGLLSYYYHDGGFCFDDDDDDALFSALWYNDNEHVDNDDEMIWLINLNAWPRQIRTVCVYRRRRRRKEAEKRRKTLEPSLSRTCNTPEQGKGLRKKIRRSNIKI